MPLSLLDRLEQFFRANPGEWVDGKRLERIAGSYAWRTRVSDLRLRRGMVVENRLVRVKRDSTPDDTAPHHYPGTQQFTISEYRYVPPQEPQQASLLESTHDHA